MKLEKKHWAMLIAGVVVLFLVYWFFFRKKKTESSFNGSALPLIGRGEFGNENNYAGIYGSFGNESGYQKDQLTNGLPNLES
jgi:LPXTG-motif cell wall-anchored protein